MTEYSVKYRAAAPVSFAGLNGLADAGRADSANIDNSLNRDIETSIKLVLNGGNASATGVVRVEIKRSHENAEFEDNLNSELLSVVQLNGTMTVVAIVEGVRLSPHQKISIVNSSGAALAASGNGVELVGLKYTDE